MSLENLVGLCVIDNHAYGEYRRLMTPLLERLGGGFRYDFVVTQTLRPSGSAINRVFVIHFPDAAAKAAFFSDPEYLAIKERYFAPAVLERKLLAEYERAD